MSGNRGLSPAARRRFAALAGSFSFAVRFLAMAMVFGFSGIASADYRKALDAYARGQYDEVLVEVRRADPIADKQGLRALVRVIDKDQSDGAPFPTAIPNIDEIAVALDKAAEAAGDGESIYRLQTFVPRPWPSDHTRLYILRCKRAAELGYAPAQNAYSGSAVSPDAPGDLVISERESMEWLRRAAEGGDIEAQIFVARLRQWIRHNLQDPVLKRELSESLPPTHWVEWMEKAAANEEFDSGLSHPDTLAKARANLASAYAKGMFGAPVDHDRAYQWATLAADAGEEYGQTVLRTLQSKGYKPAVDSGPRNGPNPPLSPDRQ